jgi:alpha-glucosidase (family GH31 glycosyl hydrolase)
LVRFWDDAIHEEQGYHELLAPLDRIPLFVRSGAILPLLSEPTETLTDMAPEQLFADVRLLVYPRHRVGSAPSEFRFHDGSGVLVSEGEGGLRVTLEGTTPERRYTVRLPRGLSVREARVDGETAEGISPTGDSPGWWNDVLDGSYLVRLPRGASEVELRYG